MLEDALRQIIVDQRRTLPDVKDTVPRRMENRLSVPSEHALILSGIRRCGKSTLLLQMMEKTGRSAYFNFEDPRLSGMQPDDFGKLLRLLEETWESPTHYFLDEIQAMDRWESFVRLLLDRQKRVVATGSNASLLSRDLGTKLTGRHLRYELFPFSYRESLRAYGRKNGKESLQGYLANGGFPAYLREKNPLMLQQLLSDVLARDIAVRHRLREVRTIEQMAVYLLNNVGKPFSFNSLAKTFGLGSTNTAQAFVSYLEDAYLLFTINKFDYSLKRQAVNPKKAYSVDNGLSSANSTGFSADEGRRLENATFLHLRRHTRDLHYFKGKNECDFLAKGRRGGWSAIQACYRLHEDNQKRETQGLLEAMRQLKLEEGLIVTFDQEDALMGDGKKIRVLPAWKWMRRDPFEKTLQDP